MLALRLHWLRCGWAVMYDKSDNKRALLVIRMIAYVERSCHLSTTRIGYELSSGASKEIHTLDSLPVTGKQCFWRIIGSFLQLIVIVLAVCIKMVEEQVTNRERASINGAACHHNEEQQDEEASFKQRVESLLLCPVCHETVTDPRQLNCGHFFCLECVDLLTVENFVKCAKCGVSTAIPGHGIRPDELAAKLIELLAQFGPQTSKAAYPYADEELVAPPTVNGVHEPVEEDHEEPEPNEDPIPSEDELELIATPTRPPVEMPTTPAIAMAATPTIEMTATPTVEAGATPAVEAATTPAVEITTIPAVEMATIPAVEMNATPPIEMTDAPPIEMTDTPPIEMTATPPVAYKADERNAQDDSKDIESAVEPPETIIEPPVDYQSPEEDVDEPLPPPPPPIQPGVEDVDVHETAREPVEHDATETVEREEAASESSTQGTDEQDSRMKPSEIKPSDVAISIEMERQCGDCHSTNCTCNCSSTLLTPPVSNGSQLSVETNSSNSPSEDEPEILVKQLTKFPVAESASHVEVANRNRIYVTRWTYDDDGAVCTFDCNGKKIKFVHSGHNNYSGITLSKLGFIFALNTSKNRIEEYSGVDGKKVKQFKLETCRDPQAVDIMPTGEILVVDQERNRVIVYPNNKKGNSKPRIIKHEMIREPYDIAATSEGFYLTCAVTHCLIKMDLEGNVIWSYGHSSKTRRFKVPQGVCVDDSGHVYVVDRGSDTIYVLTKDGELKGRVSETEGMQMQKPWYVSVRDGIMAVLFSHNIVKTYQFV